MEPSTVGMRPCPAWRKLRGWACTGTASSGGRADLGQTRCRWLCEHPRLVHFLDLRARPYGLKTRHEASRLAFWPGAVKDGGPRVAPDRAPADQGGRRVSVNLITHAAADTGATGRTSTRIRPRSIGGSAAQSAARAPCGKQQQAQAP